MGKPPTTDQELQARVAALEARADATDAAVASLDARVTALEDLVTTGEPPVIGGGPIIPPDRIDNTLPEPEPQPPEEVIPPDPQPAGTARVVVTMGGQDVIFDEVEAVDIGDVVDPLAALLGTAPRFTMTCRRATVAGSPLRVDFRRLEGWWCVVVAYGDYTEQSPVNLPPYEVVISDGDGHDAVVSVPYHGFYSRWRWQSGAWPFPMTALDALYAARLLPRWDGGLTQGSDQQFGPYAYAPMGSAGLQRNMSTTGGRGDIGPVTDAQGYYLCHPSDERALSDMLAQAEAGGSFPWDFYDPATGTCIDPVVTHPSAGAYAASNGANPAIVFAPYLPLENVTLSGPPGTVLSEQTTGSPAWHFIHSSDQPVRQLRIPVNTTIPASGSVTVPVEFLDSINTPPAEPYSVFLWDGTPAPEVTAVMAPGGFQYGSLYALDTAHQPAVAYVPFLLTGDPYFLETLQHQASYCVMENASAVVHIGIGAAQQRAYGWSARTLGQVARVSPDNPPSWLQPRSVWTTALGIWEPKVWAQLQNPDPGHQALHIVNYPTDNPAYQPWQESILLIGLSWLAFLHPETEWPRDMGWLVQQAVDMTSGTSGWPQTMAGVDQLTIRTLPSASGGIDCGTWGEVWAVNKPLFDANFPTTAFPPATLWLQNPDYLGERVASMSLAWQAGATEAAAGLEYIYGEWGPALAAHTSRLYCGYAIAGPTSSEAV
ncbi:MAG TPA: hypothetical protein VJO13_18970 [Ktedonobacterales bacterium]|nr:hypothetical protein [Ktedonobacterales bacterium]